VRSLEIVSRARHVLSRPQFQAPFRILCGIDDRSESDTLIVGETIAEIRERAIIELPDDLRALICRRTKR
jgi:hypothetical protein